MVRFLELGVITGRVCLMESVYSEVDAPFSVLDLVDEGGTKGVLGKGRESWDLEVPVSFPVWPEALGASGLPPRVVKGYEITIKWFLGYCKRARCEVTRGAANAFFETAKREKLPDRERMTQWINALRWFFRNTPSIPI